MKKGFNNDVYLDMQYKRISERISMFNKLYLEFGGKLFDDYHASRVLPGFNPNVKMQLLERFKDKAEIIICVRAEDIEKKKIRADIGITYDEEVIRLEEIFRRRGLPVNNIVITQFKGEQSALEFKERIESMGINVALHGLINGYPHDVDTIVSDKGYGANAYLPTQKPLVIVTAPGPGSGKMATCLSELYHEHKLGNKAGYAKFETFPIWNLPLDHPVNIAYEAATLDLGDKNMIDVFHLEKYNQVTVNYNRDIEIFPVVRAILQKITGKDDIYCSPTDMGVNMAGYAIFDDEAVRDAAKNEIVRRYYKVLNEFKLKRADEKQVNEAIVLMRRASVTPLDRKVVKSALDKQKKKGFDAVAIELSDGTVITGRDTRVMSASASCVFNAIKYVAGIDDKIKLLAPEMIEPILRLKRETFKYKRKFLTLEEALIVLAYSSSSGDQVTNKAMNALKELSGSDAHSTAMLADHEKRSFRQLGINATCDVLTPLYKKGFYDK